MRMFVPPVRHDFFLTDDFWDAFFLAQEETLRNLATWKKFEGIQSLNPLYSVQYSTFLATFCRKLFIAGLPESSDLISCINKQHCGCEIFGHVPIPFRFVLGHSVGVVIGRSLLADGLVLFHNTTVGIWRDSIPLIGENVVLMQGSVVAGSSSVGEHSIVAPGVVVVDSVVPPHVIAFQGEKRSLVFAKNTTNFVGTLSVDCCP